MYNENMKKDALDRLIEKNEKHDSIRKKEARFAYKGSVGAIVFYLAIFPMAIWLAQDHVRFFGHDLWGIAKIFWLLGMHLLALIGFQLFFDGIGFLAAVRWVQFDQNSRWWMKTFWVLFQLFKLCIFLVVVGGLIYSAYAYTQFMRNHGSDIATYFSYWHFIPQNVFFFVMMLLLIWLFLTLITLAFYNLSKVIKLWFNRSYFVQQILPKAKNEDWI